MIIKKFMTKDFFSDTSWVTAMKGFAIIGIVLYHYFNFFISPELGWEFKIGGEGVHIFFILSAFGLALSIFSKKNIFILREWYWRHFLKILIPYYFAVIIILFSILIIGLIKNDLFATMQAIGVNKGSVMATFFLYRGFIDKYVMCINSAWWFVITILEFYLVFPFLLKFYRNFGWKTFLIFSFLLNFAYHFFYTVMLSSDSLVFSRFFLSFIFEFSFGIFLADKYINKSELFNNFIGWRPFFIGILCDMIGAIMVFQFRFGQSFNNEINAIGYFLIIINVTNLIFKFNKTKKLLINCGRLSMPIFLLHATYITLFWRTYEFTGFFNAIVFLPVYTFLVMFLALGFDKYILTEFSFIKRYGYFTMINK